MNNSSLDDALRELDAAPSSAVVAPAELLDRIVASPSSARRSRRRWLLVIPVVAVAALVAFFVALPGGGGQAYASWTPVPVALTPAEIALIGPKCLTRLDHGPNDIEQAHLALAERRGDYVALLYRNDNPDTSGSCLAHNRPGSSKVDDFKYGLAGSSGPASTAPARGFTEGAIADFKKASFTDGVAGAEVTGVTIHASGLTVQATVHGGHYVAWWPGRALVMDGAEGRSLITYDLTLADGTVELDASPAPVN